MLTMPEHHDADCAYVALAMVVAVRGGARPWPASSCTPIVSMRGRGVLGHPDPY